MLNLRLEEVNDKANKLRERFKKMQNVLNELNISEVQYSYRLGKEFEEK